MRLDRVTVVCVTAMGAMFFAPCDVVAQRTRKPNVLIIVTDDQGYADLSAYEHSAADVQTPHMDCLAKRGVLFTQVYASAPVCSPSRAGWNTGRHQVRWDPRSSFACGLPDGTPHFAAMLKKHGYATAKFGKNDYGGKTVHRKDVYAYPLNHGYDEFLGFSAHGHDFFLITEDIRKRTPDPRGHSAVVGPLQHNRGDKDFENGYLTEIFTDAVIRFMRQKRDQPFYITLSYNAVHHLIHQSPKRYLDKFGVKEIPNYDPDKDGSYAKWFNQYITLGKITDEEMRKYYLANLNCLDDNIGRVLDALDELKLADNTIVIFSSDNGASGRNFNGHRANGRLRGGKGDLTEGGHRVPFIVRWPGRIKPGLESNVLVSQSDLFATFAAIIGADLPKDAAPDSYNILPALLGGQLPNPERPVVMSSGGTGALSIRSGNWKLMLGQCDCGYREFFSKKPHPAPKPGDPPAQLYDVVVDPAEKNNLYAKHPEIVHRLRLSLQKIQAEEGYKPDRPEEPKEQLTIEQINALFGAEAK